MVALFRNRSFTWAVRALPYGIVFQMAGCTTPIVAPDNFTYRVMTLVRSVVVEALGFAISAAL